MPFEENGALVNRINGEFVKIVRKSGGANAKSWLLPGVFADLEKTCDMLKLPDDPRCIVSIHYYLPPGFAVAEPWATRWKASYN